MNSDIQGDSGDAGPSVPPASEPSTSATGGGKPVPFIRRVVDTFVAPGQLGEALRDHPAWAAALLVCTALVVLQSALLPSDVWQAMARETILQRGIKLPEGFSVASLGSRMHWGAVVGGMIVYPIMALLAAGLVALLFAFILGDEGSYKQYFALVSHAQIIPTFFGLLTVPLKILEMDPKVTLSFGTFFYFLPEGYWHRVLDLLDLTQLWALLVVAVGLHAFDAKRSVKSAALTLIGLSVAVAMVFGIFVHTT